MVICSINTVCGEMTSKCLESAPLVVVIVERSKRVLCPPSTAVHGVEARLAEELVAYAALDDGALVRAVVTVGLWDEVQKVL